MIELLVGPEGGPWRTSTCRRGVGRPRPGDDLRARSEDRAPRDPRNQTKPQLADVLLAPAVTAPIVRLWLGSLTSASEDAPGARVSSAWHLTNDVSDPRGCSLPWDDEGLPRGGSS